MQHFLKISKKSVQIAVLDIESQEHSESYSVQTNDEIIHYQ